MSHSGDTVDALSVLADETRLDILRALAAAEEPLSFSTLRERVGLRDSGRFNYHLGKLCEYFVRETEEGYELGHAGTRVIDVGGATDRGPAGATDRTPGGAADRGTGPAGGEGERVSQVGTEECPVCGEGDCGKVFHVHLSVPWR